MKKIELENAALRHRVRELEQQVKTVADARQDRVFKLHKNDFEAPLSASGIMSACSHEGVRHGYTSSVVPWKLSRSGCAKAAMPEGSRVMIKVISWRNLVSSQSTSSASSARKAYDHVFRFVHEMMMISTMQGCNVNSVNDHVVRVVSLMTDPLPAIVMEDWGESLYDFKRRVHACGTEMTFGDAADIVLDTTVGLRQMARLGIHQWDLNAGNVLVKRLASNGRVVAKICDFGFCRRAEDEQQLTSLSLVGHATHKTDYTPHIHATVMSAKDDMEAIAVRAVGFLMGFVAFPIGTHHSEYASKSVTRRADVNGWDTLQFRQFASIMRGCIYGDINTLGALHQRLTEFFA